MTRAAAFFDMDRTVLTIDTAMSWTQYLIGRGELSRTFMARALWWTALYRLAVLDIEDVATRLAADHAGDDAAEMTAKAAAWHAAHVADTVAVAARRAIERHRERGEELVLLTGSTQFAAEATAAALGIDHVLCTRLEVVDGKLTGRLAAMCFGHHKVTLAEELAAARGIDLARSWFYSDSYNDLPMLRRVGLPVAINPDTRLARHARRSRWRIERWS